jgi:hypothetical protein
MESNLLVTRAFLDTCCVFVPCGARGVNDDVSSRELMVHFFSFSPILEGSNKVMANLTL